MDIMGSVFPAMAAADAVVILAPIHSVGRIPAEAMLLGKPVAHSLGTGFVAYLEDKFSGLGYAAYRDPEGTDEPLASRNRSRPGAGVA